MRKRFENYLFTYDKLEMFKDYYFGDENEGKEEK